MLKTKKYFKALILGLALFQASFVTVPQLAHAATSVDQICEPDQGAGATKNFARCLHNIYLFTVAFVGSVSVLMFVVSGYMYMTGDEKMIGRAKNIMTRTIIAIIILLGTFAILNTLDPNLTKIPEISVPQVKCTSAASCSNLPPLAVGVGINENGYTNAQNIPPGCKAFRTQAEAQAEMTTITIGLWNINGQPGTASLTIQKCIANLTAIAFNDLHSNSKFPIHSYGGYTWRDAVGSNVLSVHALGLAIDLNDQENYMIRNGQVLAGQFWRPCSSPGNPSGCSPYSFPANGDVVTILKRHGFGWGGEWTSSKDYMHFSCAANERGSCAAN